MLLSNIMLTIRQYHIGNFIISDWERLMYATLSKFSFTFTDIKTLTNVSITVFFLASVLLINHDLYRISKNKKNVFYMIAIILVGGTAVLFFNSPRYIEKLWIMQYNGNHGVSKGIQTILVFAIIVMISTGLFACIKLFVQSVQSKLLFKKYQLRLLLIFNLITNIIFISIVIFMPIRALITSFDIYDMTQARQNRNASLVICVIILITVLSFFYHLVFSKKTNILNETIFKNPYPVKQKYMLQSENIRHIFHSYKNALFSIKMLIQKAINSHDESSTLEILNEADKSIDDFVKRTGNLLNLYNQIIIEYDYINIPDCINTACSRIVLPDNIKITKNFCTPKTLFYGDFNSITEVFINLISNASEAIQSKGIDNGEITISTWIEYPWLCISIIDNGTGISKKHSKKIFEPLFSTKQTFNNWGVGLSYVNNIISTHSGYINVKSVLGQYSEFQIALPVDDIDEVISID